MTENLHPNTMSAHKPKAKSKTVEELYVKLEHADQILTRPDTYIGSVESEETETWIYDVSLESEPNVIKNGITQRKISIVPGLFKIFDEILVNAADHKQRDKTMSYIKVRIDTEKQCISIENDGKNGIPLQMHKTQHVYVPELIFGQLLTSSNYDDNEKKTVGGKNGYGAKLANIFSNKFVIDIADGKNIYHQEWRSNMKQRSEPVFKPASSERCYTRITFYPDFTRFSGMTELDSDIVQLLSRRVIDIAGTTRGIAAYLNDTKIKFDKFEQYVDLYLTPDTTRFHCKINDRWEICVAPSNDNQFQSVSFVNSINTAKGGTHVNAIAEQICTHFVTYCTKKHKTANVKTQHVKSNIFIFVNALIENPTFDSQTKINLTSKKSNFGSSCDLPESFLKKLTKEDSALLELILSQANTKNANLLNKQNSKKTKGTLRGIPKLEDANDAGGPHSKDCTLILTEGDSAKALAVAGISVVGRDKYGVFPLKGKLMNVRDASAESVLKNAEISNLIKILGLKHKTVYTRDNLNQLRYGSIVIMTDQDYDGSHIKGLIINLFDVFWPSLLQLNNPGYIREFITPIVKCISKTQEYAFYTIPEYETWVAQQTQQQLKQYRIKYYKGLGTSTSVEAKQYFSDMQRHLIKFLYTDTTDTEAIDLAFSGKRADARKEWLADVAADIYLDQDVTAIRYYDFVHKELILFSLASNMRAIPSLVDGLKPGQRKILHICLKHNLTKEIKVAQLSGLVGKESAYHHGEQSLNQTIIGLAQSYVGSNNINLLVPSGQFGTRLAGGKDSASARYIYTYLNTITRTLYHKHDDTLLQYLTEENQSIEPTYFVPVVPMVLINGSNGIGTGWSSYIPNYNIREIISNIQLYIEQKQFVRLQPYYKGFSGEIIAKSPSAYTVFGRIESLDNNKYHISELPIAVWISDYKESVLEVMLEKQQIQDFREFHTEQKVSFVITLSDTQVVEANKDIYKYFKLVDSISTNNMVLFNTEGKLRRYNTVQEILQEFCDLRMQYYIKRKQYMLSALQQDVSKLENQCRFIDEVIHDKFNVKNVKKTVLFDALLKAKYLPIKKQTNKQIAEQQQNDSDSDTESSDTVLSKNNIELSDFDYLLKMEIYSLTAEKFDALNKQKLAKQAEYKQLFDTTERQLWSNDLTTVLTELDKFEQTEYNEQHTTTNTKFTPISKKTVSKTKTRITAIHGSYIPVPSVKYHTTPTRIKREISEVAVKTEIVTDGSTAPVRTISSMLQSKTAVVKKEPISKPLSKPKVERMILDSDNSNSDVDISDSDSEIDAPIVKREITQRRAAATKAKYIESESELDASVYQVEQSSDEDEEMKQPVSKPKITKKHKLASDSDDDSDIEITQSKPIPKALPKDINNNSPGISKALARQLDDSDDENSAQKLFDRTIKSSTVTGPTKRPIVDTIDISEDELDFKPVKKPAAKKQLDTTAVPKPAAKKAKTTTTAKVAATVVTKPKSTINTFFSKKADSDIDIDSDDSEKKVAPKPKTVRAVVNKPKAKKRIASSEEDEDESDFADSESDYSD